MADLYDTLQATLLPESVKPWYDDILLDTYVAPPWAVDFWFDPVSQVKAKYPHADLVFKGSPLVLHGTETGHFKSPETITLLASNYKDLKAELVALQKQVKELQHALITASQKTPVYWMTSDTMSAL